MYVGELQTTGTGQIRVLSITNLQFAPFADIVIRYRIFKWRRPGVDSSYLLAAPIKKQGRGALL